MNHGRTVLAQILDGLAVKEFARCAERYPMSRDTPALSAYDHFATMVFAQLTYRETLRDIEACLRSRRRVLYHAGIRGTVKRCNLAYANEHRVRQVKCLNREQLWTLTEARVVIEDFRIDYNTRRPNSRLGYRSPVNYAQLPAAPTPVGLRPPSVGTASTTTDRSTHNNIPD